MKKIWKIEWNEMVRRIINITRGIYIKLIVSMYIYVYIYFIGNDGLNIHELIHLQSYITYTRSWLYFMYMVYEYDILL